MIHKKIFSPLCGIFSPLNVISGQCHFFTPCSTLLRKCKSFLLQSIAYTKQQHAKSNNERVSFIPIVSQTDEKKTALYDHHETRSKCFFSISLRDILLCHWLWFVVFYMYFLINLCKNWISQKKMQVAIFLHFAIFSLFRNFFDY
jgi:hypothetical protein